MFSQDVNLSNKTVNRSHPPLISARLKAGITATVKVAAMIALITFLICGIAALGVHFHCLSAIGSSIHHISQAQAIAIGVGGGLLVGAIVGTIIALSVRHIIKKVEAAEQEEMKSNTAL